MTNQQRRQRLSRKPEGWDLLEETIQKYQSKLREAEMEDAAGKRKDEALWPIFRIHQAQSRFIYEQYTSGNISRELFDYCLQNNHADNGLISKWKKPGFERLCCVRCVQVRDTQYQTVCVCRVPRKDLSNNQLIECTHCGCRGCSSSDN